MRPALAVAIAAPWAFASNLACHDRLAPQRAIRASGGTELEILAGDRVVHKIQLSQSVLHLVPNPRHALAAVFVVERPPTAFDREMGARSADGLVLVDLETGRKRALPTEDMSSSSWNAAIWSSDGDRGAHLRSRHGPVYVLEASEVRRWLGGEPAVLETTSIQGLTEDGATRPEHRFVRWQGDATFEFEVDCRGEPCGYVYDFETRTTSRVRGTESRVEE